MSSQIHRLLSGLILFFVSIPTIAQSHSQDTVLYLKLYEEGMEHYIKGDNTKAKQYVIKLSELAYKNGWEDKWVGHTIEISSFELYEGDFEKALELLDSLVQLSEEGKIRGDINKFKIYDWYSGFLANDGDIESSQVFLTKAQELIPKLPAQMQNTSLQKLENGRALNYYKFGDLRRAKASFLRSIDLLHQAYLDGVYSEKDEYEFAKVILYKNVANNEILAGEFPNAKLYLDSAVLTFSELTDPYYRNSPMAAAINNSFGDYYKGLGNFELAEKAMKNRIEELEKYEKRINLQMRIEARQNLANLYFKNGINDLAKSNYEISLEYLKDLKTSESSKYRYLWKIIDFYQNIGEDSLSNQLLSEVDFETDPIRLYYSGAETSVVSMYALKARSLAKALPQDKEWKTSNFLDFNRKALSISNQIGMLNQAGLSNSLEAPTKLALDSYIANLYMLYNHNPESKTLIEALNVIEFANNKNYNDQLITAHLARNNPDSSLVNDKKKLKRKLDELEKKFASGESDILLDSIVKVSYRLETLNEKLIEAIPEIQTMTEFRVNEDILEGINLAGDQQAFHFYYSESTLYILSRLGKENDLNWAAVPTRNLDRLIETSNSAFREIPGSGWQQAGKQLFQILLNGRISPEIKRLVIYPHGNIGLVPFAALIDTKGNYLVENYSISIKNRFEKNDQGSFWPKRPTEILAFAPYFESSEQQVQRNLYGYLGGTREEVAGISRHFKTKLYEGLSATKQNFIRESKSNKFIHLATHAFAEPNVMFSKIIFSGDDNEDIHSLFGYEIAGLNLDVEMLILSACQTGYGKFQLGEGISSLAKLFSDAGTKSLLFTLWNVDDYASAELMTLYYSYLESGLEKDLALQAAQKTYLQKNEETKNIPFFWAGFVVSGDVAPVYKSRLPLFSILIVIAIIGFLIVMLIRKKTQNPA